MKQVISPLQNQDGSILVISMLMLALITLVAIKATETGNLEILISGNDKSQRQAFYNVESAYTAVFPLLDDIRTGVDPTDFTNPATSNCYPSLIFIGDQNWYGPTNTGTDFWNEPLNDPDNVTDLASLGTDPGPDVIVSPLSFPNTIPPISPPFGTLPIARDVISGVDVDQLDTDMAGESLINRAGYEGLGKGSAGGWVGYYRMVAQGEGGKGSVNQIVTYIISVR